MHSEVFGVHGQVEFPQRGRWGKCLQEGRQPALDLHRTPCVSLEPVRLVAAVADLAGHDDFGE